jgi:hypothetical protein
MMYLAEVVALSVLAALPAAANVINSATVTDDCSGYTIVVGGKDLYVPATVDYTITLTPTKGTPIVVTDSIAVTPDPITHTFSATASQTWAHYSETLTAKGYLLSGTATLMRPKETTHKIDFTPDALHCATAAVTCLASSSLAVLVQAPKVTTYIPNGAWDTGSTGLQVVPIEPAPGTNTTIATPNVVNSCASNSVTGETVCSSNANDVYLITGTTLNKTLTSGGNTGAGFSGGDCITCGVAMNESANKAVLTIGLSTAPSGSAIQYLDLASSTLETPIPMAHEVSEDIAWDQSRNLVLSPDEDGWYDLVNTTTGAEYGNDIGGTLDSAAEDCKTGIALATDEFTTELYITDLTQATFTPGSPGTWTAPGQFVNFPEFGEFAAGTDGIAVAPGAELAIVTGEFGGDAFGIVQLPATSGTGTPAFVDYAAAVLPALPGGGSFEQGLDPHTVTAYVSPTSGKAFGLMANGYFTAPTYVAVIDMAALLAAPRLSGTHTVDPAYDLIAHGVVVYVPTT